MGEQQGMSAIGDEGLIFEWNPGHRILEGEQGDEDENDQDDHTYVYFVDEDEDLPSAYDEYDDVSEETSMSLHNNDDNVVITQDIEATPEDQQMDSPNIAEPEVTEVHMVENQGAPPTHHVMDSQYSPSKRMMNHKQNHCRHQHETLQSNWWRKITQRT